MDDNKAEDDLLGGMGGDRAAVLERLTRLVYKELRALAAQYMKKERMGHTLQPTALVHEAYLRLQKQSRVQWQGRTHFFAIAAKEMRRVLVDHARAYIAEKRWGGQHRVSLEGVALLDDSLQIEVLAFEEALSRLADLNPRQARVVELRFFGGLEVPEVACQLGVSERTVTDDWRVAKAWLRRELGRVSVADGR